MQGILLIKNIANAHPERVRLLYRKYGIDTDVTPQSIALAVVAYGDPFISDLAQMLAQDKALVGTDGTTPTVEKAWYEKLKDSLSGISEVIQSGGDIWGNISALWGDGGGGGLSTQEQAQINLEVLKTQQEQARMASQQKTMIFAIAGVAVFAIIALVIFKK